MNEPSELETAQARIASLEAELAQTKEKLRAYVEQLCNIEVAAVLQKHGCALGTAQAPITLNAKV